MAALLIFLHHNLSSTDTLCAWRDRKENSEDDGKPIDILYPRAIFEPYSTALPDEVHIVTITVTNSYNNCDKLLKLLKNLLFF